jgi:hypothetical protein
MEDTPLRGGGDLVHDFLDIRDERSVLGRERDLTCLAEDVDQPCISADRLKDRRRTPQTILVPVRLEEREGDGSGEQCVQVKGERRSDRTIERETRRGAQGVKQLVPIVRLKHEPSWRCRLL